MEEARGDGFGSTWRKPGGGARSTLCIYNTLTRTKVPFTTVKGNRVRWYNCGPTVYDASHIGHARNYVSFDIIRRILEDYFSYDVTLIMNITDIDDKIIIRARQEYLYGEYVRAHPTTSAELLGELERFWAAYVGAKLAIAVALPLVVEGDKWHALCGAFEALDGAAAITEEKAKERLIWQTAREARAALDGHRTAAAGSDAAALLGAFRDILYHQLDGAQGAKVTDQKIFRDLAAYWEDSFLADMAALNVRPASLMTRVTEFVPQVVECVLGIIKNGFAYESNGSVYFDVAAFNGAAIKEDGAQAPADAPREAALQHVYAKLCPWSAGNCKLLAEGEGALIVDDSGTDVLGGAGKPTFKRDGRDFALWKASKAGEPFWPSPWGNGRPGWHIECSAMAAAVAPGTLDIHSGGIDLAFPHHDNEIAQSEALLQSPQWVNYFMHAGHVHIEGLKMSKSLKNFISIQDALERYSATQLRLMFLQHQWNAPVYFKESSMASAVAVEGLLSSFVANVVAHIRSASAASKAQGGYGGAPPCAFGVREGELVDLLNESSSKIHDHLCDNFDTPAVILQLQELIGRTNVYMQQASSEAPLNVYVLKMVGKFVLSMLDVFGVAIVSAESGARELLLGATSSLAVGGGSLAGDSVSSATPWETLGPILEQISAYRDVVRATVLSATATGSSSVLGDLIEQSDALRDRLGELGVLFEDRTGQPTLVKYVGRAHVERMKRDKEARDEEKALRKAEMARINEEKAERRRAKAAIDPATMFRSLTVRDGAEDGAALVGEDGDRLLYSAFDANGIPTALADGSEVGKSARKKLVKEYEAQVALHARHLGGTL